MNLSGEYQFLVSTSKEVPQAHGTLRGHAIRKAFRMTAVTPQGDAEVSSLSSASYKTIELRDTLKGRMRLASGSAAQRKKSRTGAATASVPARSTEKSSDQAIQLASMASSQPNSANDDISTIESFRNNAVDPFCSVPVSQTPGLDALLQFCEYRTLYGTYVQAPNC